MSSSLFSMMAAVADAAHAVPAWVALALLMVVTMTLSDVLNNVATAVIAAPALALIGVAIAFFSKVTLEVVREVDPEDAEKTA